MGFKPVHEQISAFGRRRIPPGRIVALGAIYLFMDRPYLNERDTAWLAALGSFPPVMIF
jgi:hypothetical protein